MSGPIACEHFMNFVPNPVQSALEALVHETRIEREQLLYSRQVPQRRPRMERCGTVIGLGEEEEVRIVNLIEWIVDLRAAEGQKREVVACGEVTLRSVGIPIPDQSLQF